jgi:VWFA-related protein
MVLAVALAMSSGTLSAYPSRALAFGGAVAEERPQGSYEPQRDFAVRLTAPASGEQVLGRVELRAEVEVDRPDAVLFVEFEIDGRLLFSDATAPYGFVWRTRQLAVHRIVARAYGAAGEIVEDGVDTAAPPSVAAASRFTSRVERVEMYVHVDKKRRPDELLDSSDFVITEEGVQQPILEVEHSSDLPLSIGLMIDCSGSMIERLEYALETAGGFIAGLMQQQNDEAFVMSFADLPSVLQEFTDDVDRLSASLDLITAGRYTRLYDSIVAAAGAFDGHTGRRALVILTDGHDGNSTADLADAIQAAQRAEVAIYPVGVGLDARYFFERWVLEKMAGATGGRALHLRTLDDPRKVYDTIADDLRQQYRLTYEPLSTGGSGEWRNVEILLAEHGSHKMSQVRSRPGYFAE